MESFIVEFQKKFHNILRGLEDKYYIYLLCLKKEIEEHKAITRCWGGQDERRYVQEFNKLIVSDIEKTFTDIDETMKITGRKLTKKQTQKLEEEFKKSIEKIIINYKNNAPEIMGHLSSSSELSLDILTKNLANKVSAYFSMVQFYNRYKIDKALRLAIISNAITATGVVISLLELVFDLF